MKRLLIVHRSPRFGEAVAEMLRGAYLVRTVYDGGEALEAIEEFCPHGLLIHTGLPRKDGLTVLAQTAFLPAAVVCTTDYLDSFVAARCAGLGARQTLLMPSAATAAEALLRWVEGTDTALPVWLHSLGFRPGMAGYRLLLPAAEALKKDPGQALSGIYEKLGHGAAVEKAIRAAIHTAWQEGERQVWHKYFGAACPGNKTFLLTLLQTNLHGVTDHHGAFRDGAIHRQHPDTGSGGFP